MNNRYDNNPAQLSKTNAGKGCSRILGIILLIWALGIVYIVKNDDLDLNALKLLHSSDSPIYIFIGGFILFLMICAFFLLTAQTKTYVDSDVHEYTTFPKVFNSIRLVIVFLIFIFPFSLLIISESSDSGFQIFGAIVMCVFWIAFVFIIIDMIKKLKSYKKLGKSILLTDNSSYKLGNTMKLRIKNENIQDIELSFCLRNLYEYWESDGENSRLLYKTLYEENKKGYADQLVEFSIPSTNDVMPTKYDYTEPYYWSIEVTNAKLEFYNQFIINVRE